MSPFYRNFITNGRARRQPVVVLREALAEACEEFFDHIQELPRPLRRAILIRELRRLAAHYREEDED